MILFPSNDFKYIEWSKELNKFGIKTSCNNTQYPFFLFLIIKGFLFQNLQCVVFRYLNDKRSFTQTFIIYISEYLSVLFCKVTKVKILWILHNVDKESEIFHPVINNLRRNNLIKRADNVLVTDPVLINRAELLGIKRSIIDWVSFGKIDKPTNSETKNLKSKIQRFAASHVNDRGKVRIGLCVTSSKSKFLHFKTIVNFVHLANKKSSHRILMVLVGEMPSEPEYFGLKEKIQDCKYVLYIPQKVFINLSYLSDIIDFYYRAVDDFSISYSVYDAVFANKPMIVENYGILPEIVEKYGIGFKVSDELFYSDTSFVNHLNSVSELAYINFLNERSWEKAAQKIKRTCCDREL